MDPHAAQLKRHCGPNGNPTQITTAASPRQTPPAAIGVPSTRGLTQWIPKTPLAWTCSNLKHSRNTSAAAANIHLPTSNAIQLQHFRGNPDPQRTTFQHKAMLNARQRNPYFGTYGVQIPPVPHLCGWTPRSQCNCPRRLSTKTPWQPLQQSLLELTRQPIATPYAARFLDIPCNCHLNHTRRARDTLPHPETCNFLFHGQPHINNGRGTGSTTPAEPDTPAPTSVVAAES